MAFEYAASMPTLNLSGSPKKVTFLFRFDIRNLLMNTCWLPVFSLDYHLVSFDHRVLHPRPKTILSFLHAVVQGSRSRLSYKAVSIIVLASHSCIDSSYCGPHVSWIPRNPKYFRGHEKSVLFPIIASHCVSLCQILIAELRGCLEITPRVSAVLRIPRSGVSPFRVYVVRSHLLLLTSYLLLLLT